MVQHQYKRGVLPDARSAADRATAQLGLGEKEPNEVTLLAAHPGLTGFEPQSGTGVASGCCLTSIAAIDLLASPGKWCAATKAQSHGLKLRDGTDMPDNALSPLSGLN